MRVLWMFFLFGPTALGTTDFFKYEYAGDGTRSCSCDERRLAEFFFLIISSLVVATVQPAVQVTLACCVHERNDDEVLYGLAKSH